MHALAEKKKMGLQKRSQNFACFGRVKKTISKALGQIPMNWEALQKRWGLFVCFWTQRPNPPPSLAPCPKGCPRGMPEALAAPEVATAARLPDRPRHGRRWPGCKSFHVVNHFERKIRNEKTFVKFFFHFFLLSVKLPIRATAVPRGAEVSEGYGPWLGGVAGGGGLGCPSVGGVRGLAVPHEAHEVGPRSLRIVAGYLRYSEGLRRCVGAVGGVPVAGPTLGGV